MTTHAKEAGVPPVTRSRLSKGLIITLLALGWLALLWATSLSLQTAIQTGMVGLGAIGTAIVAALWRP
jgi:hypothetical protein